MGIVAFIMLCIIIEEIVRDEIKAQSSNSQRLPDDFFD